MRQPYHDQKDHQAKTSAAESIHHFQIRPQRDPVAAAQRVVLEMTPLSPDCFAGQAEVGEQRSDVRRRMTENNDLNDHNQLNHQNDLNDLNK